MNYKIIIIGSVGSGKTTAIKSLIGKNAALTDSVVSCSEQYNRRRQETATVEMDFDIIHLNDEVEVHVYGTPGQESYNPMWDVLSKGAHGVILLLDISRNYPFRDLKYYTNRFSELIRSSRLIVGLTHADIQKNISTESFTLFLKRMKIEANVIPIDARDKDDVTLLIHNLLDIPREKFVSAFDSETKPETIEKRPSNMAQYPYKKDNRKGERRKLNFLDKNMKTRFKPEEAIKITEEVLCEVAKLEHVKGVSLTRTTGEMLHTTINDEGFNKFLVFFSGIIPEIEGNLKRGKINRVMLRSPKDDNLTFFVEHDKSLGVCSDREKPVQELTQRIEDVLQWY